MTEMLFIRHGATEGNLERRYIGRTDEPLCREGVGQMETLREMGYAPDLVFTSPMLRARQSAAILFPGVPCRIVDDFRETDFGIFEGKTAEELSGDERYETWLGTMCSATPPGGESADELRSRCAAAFRETAGAVPDGSRAAFVVHGGTIMAVLEAFAEPKRDFYDYHIGNGECILCTYSGGKLTAVRKPEK